ncbi:MAG TPA: transglutaminaseTgpA domain-containing protein, partial [Anaerolineae bacterium]|nr:transglutaminaseTgpA domain-containing protein [Anaerolineae bacterium]
MDKRLKLDRSKSIVLLAAGLVMTVTWAVGATGWTEGLNIITFVGLGSIIIGMMLARSILPGFVAHLFSVIIGVSWSFWVTSRLLPEHYTWLERWANLTFRLNYWYSQAMLGGTSYDNMMFILQMGVIVWGTGYLTLWFLFRSGKVWQAIVPGGLVLLINLYYAPNDITLWFLIFILLSLLLAIRFNLFKQEAQWRAEGVFFRPDISFDFLRDGFIFSALVIALAWITPPIADAQSLELLDEFQGSWRDVQGEWNRLFADLNYKDTGLVDGFGPSLNLGGPRRLTNEPVMNVKVEGPGRYWRATVYDEYTGYGWRNNDLDTAGFGPETALSLPLFEARVPVTQTYTFYRDQATVLYAMAQPLNLDRSAKVTFNALSNEQIAGVSWPTWLNNGEPWVEEITYIRSNAAIDSGESYQVVSAFSQASISQLEAAGNDYPAWITARYLQLPDSVTERTRNLALELAEPFDDAFGKARAIEAYLRREIKYNEKLISPPPGVDRVDYVIFETKEAYCDYYASAMIVMLRSLGIPARFAVGFAQGSFNNDLEAFHVVNADAHSWVEVYFPQYGWIEFEPTAAQPSIVRPTASENMAGFPFDSALNPNGIPGPREMPERSENIPEQSGDIVLPFILTIPWVGTQISIPRSVVNGSGILMIIILMGVLAAGVLWWQRQTKPTGDILKLYQRMLQLARWMGAAIRPWQTPYEHAVLL